MNKSKLVITLFLVLLLLISFCTAEPEEFLNEFSNYNETCQIIDFFVYQIGFFSKKVPVLYNCCNQDDCTTIILDTNNNQLVPTEEFKELIHLNFIKYSLDNGNLTISSFTSHGMDACYFHGDDELRKETMNLVGETAEEIALAKKSKKAQQVVTTVRTAKAIEIISPFSIVDFSLSVACHYNNKKIKVAVEELLRCNLYLSNIRSNYAQKNYVMELNLCLDKARENFAIYKDSKVALVKHGIEKVGNAITAAFRWVNDPASNFEMEDTEYETASRIYNEIAEKELFLYNSHVEEITTKYLVRINEKSNHYASIKNELLNQLNALSKISPNLITLIYEDIFFEPNHNISIDISTKNLVENNIDGCDRLFSDLKFNSAINCLINNDHIINQSHTNIQKDQETVRFFDPRWKHTLIIGAIIISVAAILILFIMFRRNTTPPLLKL